VADRPTKCSGKIMTALPANDTRARKDERVAVRVPADVKQTLERAASCSGRSLSDFVVESALRAAQQTLEASLKMQLAEKDRQVFLAALVTPPMPNAALMAAAKRYDRANK